jgi:hypothetical protein
MARTIRTRREQIQKQHGQPGTRSQVSRATSSPWSQRLEPDDIAQVHVRYIAGPPEVNHHVHLTGRTSTRLLRSAVIFSAVMGTATHPAHRHASRGYKGGSWLAPDYCATLRQITVVLGQGYEPGTAEHGLFDIMATEPSQRRTSRHLSSSPNGCRSTGGEYLFGPCGIPWCGD